jgi:DNA-binding HxlR family transcriptional regulator
MDAHSKDANSNGLDHRRTACSIAATLDFVGEKWTLLVLREAFFGVRRFDDILAALGCARNVLSARLATLVEAEILVRVPYREAGSRPRYEYALSPKGRELYPILLALMQWGDAWCQPAGTRPVIVRHVDCGSEVRAEIRCALGHGPLPPRETSARSASALTFDRSGSGE